MPNQILKLSSIEEDNTKKIFRTAYFIAKNQRPFTDMPKLADLHQINGLHMSRILQTNKACGNIIDHITLQMRKKLCSEIVVNKENSVLL
ncbi:unnamed protein product [Macrosiphum euphorbiae]|uniref:Uncharacterized protein n=1 Tax=Macrosiphum euphorbiae TaxID=13131 RepID=A0AAV0XQP3_9HEMI|nr:unnamed protein product [Macrosiphum euphorbiae]